MSLGWSRYGCRRSGCRRTDVAATLKARVAELEAELAQAKERSRGHRADFERERADRPATRRAELFPQYRPFSSRRGPLILPEAAVGIPHRVLSRGFPGRAAN